MGCCASCFGASAPAQSVQLATPVERGCLHARACSGAINLNTCSAADLQSVPGIGRVLADRIVKARPFTVPTTADCVLGVRGIGRVTVGKLQPHLCPCFGGPPAAVGAAACVRTSDVRINAGPRYLAPPVAVTKRSLAAGVVTSHTWHEQLLFGDLSPAQAATPEFNVRHSTSDASGASSILLASWNIRNLSVGRQDLNLAVVARLMSQFDVVSLQEVRDTTIVESLLQALNACSAMPVWRYIVSGPVTLVSPDTQPTAPASGSSSGAGTTEAAHRTTCHTELYAVFWQDHRVERLDNPRSRFGGLHRFSREPFFCTFRCRVPSGAGTAFDFVLASIHVVFASGDTARRRADIRALHRLVAAMIEVGVDQDVILAGDFNIGPRSSVWEDTGWAPSIHAATTIYGSMYDNICVLPRTRQQWLVASGVVRFDRVLFPGVEAKQSTSQAAAARNACSRAVSDHRPVWAQFRAATATPARGGPAG